MNDAKNEAAGGASTSDVGLDVRVDPAPAAWMTYDLNGNPMFWALESEAALYCDDGERPIPLYMPANAQGKPTAANELNEG